MLDFHTIPLEFRAYQQEFLSPFQNSAFYAREDCFFIHELHRKLGGVDFALLNQG